MNSGCAEGDLPRRLQNGLETLALDLGGDQQELLLRYLTLLQRWNAVHNLTAVREPSRMLSHHLLDSLAIIRPLQRLLAARQLPCGPLLDVGSGAGLPGVVVAIASGWKVTCVDKVGKKAGFIRQVVAELGLSNVEAVHGRAESLMPRTWPVIVSRAFASLESFIALTEPLLGRGGVWVAMKAKPQPDEIAALPSATRLFHVEPLVVPELDAERCLMFFHRKSTD